MSTAVAKSPMRTTGGEAVILYAAAGHTFAIAATAVEEIRAIEAFGPSAPRGKVHSLLKQASRTHQVVDAAKYFQLPARPPRHLMVLRDSDVALAIDAVERMTTVNKLYALPRAFSGDERRWYRGLALMEGNIIPVVDPENILTHAELGAAEAAGACRA